MVVRTMLVVHGADDGEVEAHEQVRDRQVSNHHADRAVFVVELEATPKNHRVTDAR